jgi:hypothetical protein
MYDTCSDVNDKDGIKRDVDKYRLQKWRVWFSHKSHLRRTMPCRKWRPVPQCVSRIAMESRILRMSSSSFKQQLNILITVSELLNSGHEDSTRSKCTPMEPVRLIEMRYKNCIISQTGECLLCMVRIQNGLQARIFLIAIYCELGLKYAIKNVHENQDGWNWVGPASFCSTLIMLIYRAKP